MLYVWRILVFCCLSTGEYKNISREHARFEWDGKAKKWTVVVLGKNGIEVNGVHITIGEQLLQCSVVAGGKLICLRVYGRLVSSFHPHFLFYLIPFLLDMAPTQLADKSFLQIGDSVFYFLLPIKSSAASMESEEEE